MIKRIYLLTFVKDIAFGTYETIRSTLPQPIKNDDIKYREMVDRDLKFLFVTTIYSMDHVQFIYETTYSRIKQAVKGKLTNCEIHERALEITKNRLHFDTANNRNTVK